MLAATRLLSVSAAALLLITPPAGDELDFHAQEGVTVLRTIDHEVELELESFTIEVDGEEVPPEYTAGAELNIVDSEHIVVVDEFGPLDEGRPGSLRRTFEELSGANTQTDTGPGGEESEQENEKSSDLEGTTVLFTWDGDEEAYSVEFEDAGDEDLLALLEEDMDLRGFLPTGEVEEGDSWEADIEAFERLFAVGGDLGLSVNEPSDIDDQLDDNLTGEVLVTYAGTRTQEGVLVAVLELEINVATEGEESIEGPAGSEILRALAIEHELEGELTWNLAGGHLHGSDVSGRMAYEITDTVESDASGQTMEFVQTRLLTGKAHYVVSVEVQ